jgi:GMP synthase (glutamine-hydrolysing)
MECIVVHHIAFEDLGSFATPLRERGYEVACRHAGTAPLSLEEWLRADLIVVLGGPIGAGDVDTYPWLREELAGLRARIGRGLPVLGICLGAQLIALALGGGVERRAGHSEIGWRELDLGPSPGVLAGLAGVPVLHWHGDNITLPPKLAPLASTPGTPCQAFAAGTPVLGLQFHAEFAGTQLEAWLSGHAVELAHAGIDLHQLRADTARHADSLERAGRVVLQCWLDGLHR